jgi:hypothetical protein
MVVSIRALSQSRPRALIPRRARWYQKRKANVIYRFKLLSSLFLLCLVALCSCLNTEESSAIPEDQAKIIRQILRENGYEISDKENVDQYLELESSFEHYDKKDLYWILLPSKSQKTLVLSKKINMLDQKMYIGVKSYSAARNTRIQERYLVENISIIDDTIIDVGSLFLSNNKINPLPLNSSNLRFGVLDLSGNEILELPDELMLISQEPVLYPSFIINLNNNKIDTSKISSPLKDWLQEYASPGWEETQNPD